MSFDSLQMTYKPPPTIPSAPRAAFTLPKLTASGPASAGRINPGNTVAGLLITQLGNLSKTSTYLQTAILSKCAGSGLSFTASENPGLASALANLYPGNDAPQGITVEMYAHMLDAEIALMQLQSAIGNNADIEPSPQNLADLTTATRAFESAMIGSLGYQNNLTVLLRGLKGDQAIQANIQEQLADYPAVRGTFSTLDDGLDISEPMSSLMDNYVQDQSNVYGQMFTSLTTASDVENDMVGVASFLLSGGVSEICMMIASLSSLREMLHGEQLKNLAGDIANSIFVSLLSEVSGVANQLDRLASVALSPLQVSTSSAAHLVRSVQGLAAQVGYITVGGLKGMVQGNSCSRNSGNHAIPSSTGSTSPSKITASVNKVLGPVSSGMNSVLSHLNMATNFVNHKNDQFQESLRKLAARRTKDQTAQLDLLCSLRNLEAMITLATSLITATTSSSAGSKTISSLQAINQVLSSFTSPSGSSFSMANSAVVVTPPTVPPVPSDIQIVLNRGGAGLVATRDLTL